MKHYDVCIIGAGWAGFNAGLKAKELGAQVALIEKDTLGGTCLNRGCIPTKILLQSAKAYLACTKSAVFGIEQASAPSVNLLKIQERKDAIIQQLRSGMQFRLSGIDFILGQASFQSAQDLRVGSETIRAKAFIICAGSRPMELPGITFDKANILSSDDILNIKEIPGSLLVIGGGVIGCEFATFFSAMGIKVTVVEKMPQLLPQEDAESAKKLEQAFKKKGIKVLTNTDVHSVDMSGFDKVLLCVGRVSATDGLGLNEIGVKTERGKIVVDEYLRTSVASIYAAGDCTGKIMLAHFAAYQGETAAHNCLLPGELIKADTAAVPNCIFTDPEISNVGLSEEQSKAKNYPVKVHKFDFQGSGMARILGEANGFIKIISDDKTGVILGAALVGPRVTELISVFSIAVTNKLSVAQVKNTIFAHPTLSESIREALK